MLSEPPNDSDRRALCALLEQHGHGVGERQRQRLRAMGVIEGPPYCLTSRALRVLGALGLLLSGACGGSPFELFDGTQDAGDVAVSAPSKEAGAGDAPSRETQSPDGAGESSVVVRDGAGDVATNGNDTGSAFDAAPLVDAGPDVDAGAPLHEAGELDASGALDADSGPPACASAETFTYVTGKDGCMCSTPAYTCLAWGAMCGSCPPTVDASPFGHADGACATPGVCIVGAPCVWESASGARITGGSVIACP